jgi:predicted MPP superfamily phosphohydrolase
MRGWERLIPKNAWGATWRVALILVVAFAADAFWLEPSSLRIAPHSIVLKRDGGKSFDRLRIAVIADLHAGAPYIDAHKVEKVVRLTNQERPDLILLAGDYVVRGVVGKHYMPIELIAPLLKPLHARLGVYAVIGNHDRWDNAERIARELEKAGITVLENRAVAIRNHGQTIYLAGIGDDYTHAAKPALALASVPAGQPALCLTHSPDIFPSLPATCLLTIAAHTHGGQVRLPLLGRLIVPSKYGRRYAAGTIHEQDRYMFVNTGIGTSMIPVRFRVPPEISILDLRADD